MRKEILVTETDVRTDDVLEACIVKFDDVGKKFETISLNLEELTRELEKDKWDNPYPQWIDSGVQRLTYERK